MGRVIDKAEVIRTSPLKIQVCVPKTWDDEFIEIWINKLHPTGISSRWTVIKEGHEYLDGYPERVQCEEYDENCHICLMC